MTIGAALLLVALCGGYYFVSVSTPTRYHSAREVGHRFYFRVVHYAIWLALVASWLLFTLSRNVPESWQTLVAGQAGLFPPPATYMEFLASPLSYGIAPFTLLLAIVGSHGLNGLLRLLPGVQNRILRHAVSGRDFENLMLHAHQRLKPLLLTLENGEVYVGLVSQALNPAKPREHLRVIPVFSGYKDQNTMEVVLTTDYDAMVRRIGADDALSQHALEEFELVVPADRIVSASVFDRALYQLSPRASG